MTNLAVNDHNIFYSKLHTQILLQLAEHGNLQRTCMALNRVLFNYICSLDVANVVYVLTPSSVYYRTTKTGNGVLL